MSRHTRRTFLQRAALAGGALVLPSGALLTSVGCSPQHRERRTDHYFIFYFMLGGWDLTHVTEPVPAHGDDVWVNYAPSDRVEVGRHRFGPAFAPLVPYVDKMAILRGVFVDALNHPQARVRMCTGHFKPPGAMPNAPSVQSLLAQKLGGGYEIPNLSSDTLRPATFRGDLADERLEPVRVSSVEQLRGLVGWRGDIKKHRRDIQEALRKKDRLMTERHPGAPLADDFQAFAELARTTLDSDYRERVSDSESLLDKLQHRAMKNAQLAVEAVRQDLAPVITVGTGEFDAHTAGEYRSHPGAVLRGMRTVADIARGLESTAMPGNKTLLDHTTIVVTSEFSRAPEKNELGGKHHWPANSILLLGKGIQRTKGEPTIVGRCDDGLNTHPMNPKNGSFDKGTEDIEMQHGLATVLAMAGIDPYPHLGPFEPVLPLLS